MIHLAGGGVEYLESLGSFSYLCEIAFLVPRTQTARPFRIFLKDLSSDAREKKEKIAVQFIFHEL